MHKHEMFKRRSTRTIRCRKPKAQKPITHLNFLCINTICCTTDTDATFLVLNEFTDVVVPNMRKHCQHL